MQQAVGGAARTLGFAVLFVAAGFLGRLTIVDGGALSLVWPAAGVAVVWLLARRARLLGPDTVVLGAATYLVNTLTGASPEIGLVFVAANLALAWAVVGLLRSWTGHLWGCGGIEPLSTNRDLARLMLAATLGTLVGVVVGFVGFALDGQVLGLVDVAVWWGRNLVGVLAVGSLGLVLGERLSRGAPLTREDLAGRGWETVAVFVVSGLLFQFAFTTTALPLAFPLLVTTVWAGLRIPTLLVTIHSLAVGVTCVVYTLAGKGPFSMVADVHVGALLAQVFVGMAVVTGLALAVGRDERERLAADLRHSEAQSVGQAAFLSTVLASVTEGIALVGEDGTLLFANATARQVLGLAEGDSLRDQEVFHVDGTPIQPGQRPALRAVRGDEVAPEDIIVRDGRDRILATSGTPLPADEEGRRRAVLVYRDVTEERMRMRELSAFAGVVAHDLKNPIGVIDGWSETLEEALDAQQEGGRPVDPEQASGMLAKVRGAADRMRRLIDDLLAHATASDRTLALAAVDIGEVVCDVARTRGVEHQVEVTPLPAVLADPMLVRQLLDNLVGNAVKYVGAGVTPRVVVSGETVPGREGDLVRVSVADNGIGVPEGEHERIFEQFHRAHATAYHGTGLGLAICSRIVQRHGGEIWAEPKPGGAGSVFRFTLPAA